MNRKIVGILLVGFLILSVFGSVAVSEKKDETCKTETILLSQPILNENILESREYNKKNINLLENTMILDQLDQEQTDYDEWSFPIRDTILEGNQMVAQSFKPGFQGTYTRIKVFAKSDDANASAPLIFSIKKSLNGSDLTSFYERCPSFRWQEYQSIRFPRSGS